ncbi:hypothetical protein [Roseofilum sp. SID1]|nr:hypothetical protein [Roseofilum sp. SID1]
MAIASRLPVIWKKPLVGAGSGKLSVGVIDLGLTRPYGGSLQDAMG